MKSDILMKKESVFLKTEYINFVLWEAHALTVYQHTLSQRLFIIDKLTNDKREIYSGKEYKLLGSHHKYF